MSRIRVCGGICLLLALQMLSAAVASHADQNTMQPPANCGCASFSNLMRLYLGDTSANGPKLDLPKDRSSSVTSMLELRDWARHKGLVLTGVKCTLSEIQQMGMPCIARMEPATGSIGHFLVIAGVTDSWVRVFDGPFKPITYRRKDFEPGFSGIALVPAEAVRSSAGVPPVWAAKSIIDVGEVPAGATVVGSFDVRTREATPVRLVDYSRCCGREVTVPSDMTIRSGRMNTVKLSMKAPVGIVSLDDTVYLVTDRSRWPLVPLTVVGRVLDEVAVVPQVLDFGTVKPGSREVKQITLMRVSPDRAQFLDLFCNAKFLGAERRGYGEDTRKMIIEVSLDATGPRGRVSGEVLVRMGSGNHAVVLTVPVVGEIAGPVTVYPQEFMFGFVPRGTASTAKVTVSSQEPGFAVTDVKAPDGISVKTTKTDAGYEIEAVIGPDIKFQELDDKVTIATSSPDDKEIILPIYAAVDTTPPVP